MTSKFTPGPWEAFVGSRPSVYSASGNINYLQTRSGFQKNTKPVSLSEAQANANLIAAAPDMYEALTAFMELPHLDDDMCTEDDQPECKVCAAINIGRSALAKARGKGGAA